MQKNAQQLLWDFLQYLRWCNREVSLQNRVAVFMRSKLNVKEVLHHAINNCEEGFSIFSLILATV